MLACEKLERCDRIKRPLCENTRSTEVKFNPITFDFFKNRINFFSVNDSSHTVESTSLNFRVRVESESSTKCDSSPSLDSDSPSPGLFALNPNSIRATTIVS